MRKILLRIFQALVTVGVLAWVFRDPEMRAKMPDVLRRADPLWLALAVAVAGVGELANILRWHIFLRVQRITIPLARTAVVFMTSIFFNLFFFGVTGGDIVRATYLSVEQKHKKTGVILSVVVDRLIGLFVLVPFGAAVAVVRYRWLSQTPAAAALLWFLIVFMICITAFFAAAISITHFGLADRLPARLPGRESLVRITAALGLFGRAWRESLAAFALSFPVLFGAMAPFYCAARAFGAHASFAEIFSILPIVIVVTSFPVSISGIGVREGIFITLLGDLAGVPAETAFLISLTGFLSYVVWSLTGAVFYLFSTPQPVRSALAETPNDRAHTRGDSS